MAVGAPLPGLGSWSMIGWHAVCAAAGRFGAVAGNATLPLSSTYGSGKSGDPCVWMQVSSCWTSSVSVVAPAWVDWLDDAPGRVAGADVAAWGDADFAWQPTRSSPAPTRLAERHLLRGCL